jgi:hypothetical protein
LTGDFPYGDGSSSSDDGNSNISESTEPDLDLSSDDEEDEDDEIPEVLHRNSDSSELSEMAGSSGKTLNHVDAKDEISKFNGLKSGKKEDIFRGSLNSPPTNINGLGEDESSCCDSLVISSSSSNNLEVVAGKEINAENKDKDKDRMKNSQVLDPADVIELVTEEGLLDAVKICADWLHGDSDIIKACGRSSRTLLSRFIMLLNLINVNADAFEKGMFACIYKCVECVSHRCKTYLY